MHALIAGNEQMLSCRRSAKKKDRKGEYNKKAVRIVEWDGRGIRITIQG